jgi:hypothetical protein
MLAATVAAIKVMLSFEAIFVSILKNKFSNR